jgi:hypothetical protein
MLMIAIDRSIPRRSSMPPCGSSGASSGPGALVVGMLRGGLQQ